MGGRKTGVRQHGRDQEKADVYKETQKKKKVGKVATIVQKNREGKKSYQRENYVMGLWRESEGILYSYRSHWTLLLCRHLKRRGLQGHLLRTTSGRDHDRRRL